MRPLAAGGGTGLSLYQIEPGTRFRLHTHPFPELGLVMSGMGYLVVGNEERPASAGESYYVPASVPHGFSVPESGEPVVLLDVASADGSRFSEQLREMVVVLAEATQAAAREEGRPTGARASPAGRTAPPRLAMGPAARGARGRATAPHPPREPGP